VEHIAIDLGGRESQVCVRDDRGVIVEERRLATDRVSSFLRKRAPARVVLETCAEAFAMADAALESGHQVRVVPATLVRSLGVGARGVKTDQRDARILSEVSTRIDLPSVHVPSELSRQRKALCSSREALVTTRTKLIDCGLPRTSTYVPMSTDTRLGQPVTHCVRSPPRGNCTDQARHKNAPSGQLRPCQHGRSILATQACSPGRATRGFARVRLSCPDLGISHISWRPTRFSNGADKGGRVAWRLAGALLRLKRPKCQPRVATARRITFYARVPEYPERVDRTLAAELVRCAAG
jgi:hypothetical protein